jgi:2-iminobutanoate/2-iminopropanoate deaminase
VDFFGLLMFGSLEGITPVRLCCWRMQVIPVEGANGMTHKIHDIGVAKQIGRYSDAIETSPGLRWLYTSGTPGISKTGELPNDIEGQTRLAWEHILEALKHADMTIGDLVKVTTSLTNAKDLPTYVKVRSEILGDVRPAFMLQVVSQLIRPDMIVEVEAIAAKA